MAVAFSAISAWAIIREIINKRGKEKEGNCRVASTTDATWANRGLLN